MKALLLLLAMIALAARPGVSVAQEPTEAPSNPPPDEVQSATKAPPPQPPTPAATLQKGVQENNIENTKGSSRAFTDARPCALE
jgi:hypothetical protein